MHITNDCSIALINLNPYTPTLCPEGNLQIIKGRYLFCSTPALFTIQSERRRNNWELEDPDTKVISERKRWSFKKIPFEDNGRQADRNTRSGGHSDGLGETLSRCPGSTNQHRSCSYPPGEHRWTGTFVQPQQTLQFPQRRHWVPSALVWFCTLPQGCPKIPRPCSGAEVAFATTQLLLSILLSLAERTSPARTQLCLAASALASNRESSVEVQHPNQKQSHKVMILKNKSNLRTSGHVWQIITYLCPLSNRNIFVCFL